jgi:hypothetical protein
MNQHFIFFLLLFFKAWPHYVTQVGLELEVLLPLPPKCWDYRYILPCLANALDSTALAFSKFTMLPALFIQRPNIFLIPKETLVPVKGKEYFMFILQMNERDGLQCWSPALAGMS